MRGRPIALLAVISLLALAQAASADCIARHSVPIATGANPSGEPWAVSGTISDNGDCGEWLFGMDFELPQVGNWGWGTGIPAGGHLPENFTVDASDDLQDDGSQRVLSGTVGARTAKVVATLSNGKRLTIRPKSPSARLRWHVVWLRNVRYFVQYYLPEGLVTTISLFSAAGRLQHRATSTDGSF